MEVTSPSKSKSSISMHRQPGMGNCQTVCREVSDAEIKVNPILASSAANAPIVNRSNIVGGKRDTIARKILLLQGPVGPFFAHLQSAFGADNFEVKRVLFHGADALFMFKKSAYRFSGDAKAWESWLRAELSHNKPEAIVLFGSNRPAHKIAQKLACVFGVQIIALEEGYLRSGFITCEFGGNNQHSPLRNWKAGFKHAPTENPLDISSPFVALCFWGATYYLWRELSQREAEKDLWHRATSGAFTESVGWTTHILRRSLAKVSEKRVISKLLNHHSGDYILVPLQTPSDAQIRTASRGWNNEKLVTQSLKALLESGARETLVFKTHPLDEKSHKLTSFIHKEAKIYGLCHRVKIIRTGKLSELTQQSSGMIVINSTSAFSALHHHVPVLVLGDAVFRHESIVTVGDGAQAIKKFLSRRASRDASAIGAFFKAVKATALIAGDFYALKTQKRTAQNVVRKVNTLMATRKFSLETV